ncbi:C6 zinc finger domain protein [Aspergillus pseudoustus]|uniref:C6 zinc finger domain protein n=1 Tax=Aspergillus pseudoustus TaxID=1810923 RepID=A0ABR4J3P7_9EURO
MAEPLKKGKKACTECRQQKTKCDVYLNPKEPCTRCRKVNANCVISDPFKREHKRKRLSELEHETKDLRRKLRASDSADLNPSPIPPLTAATNLTPRTESNSNLIHGESHIPPSLYPTQLLAPGGMGNTLLTPGPVPALEAGATRGRSLHGVEVSGDEIDDLFQLFFRHYAPFLPILNPDTRPDTYYAQSPFIFWCLIGVSCRAYIRNPTLLMALARHVIEMAFLSALSTSPPWHTIQGLLLLLTWPFPKGDHPDVTFQLGGMLLHIAMGNGLHIPMSSHEFSRVKIPVPSEGDLVRRSELWAHTVIVYQRLCMIKGQLPRGLVSPSQDPRQYQPPFDTIAPWLVLRLRCQELIVRCSESVSENGVRSMSIEQERALDALLHTCEGHVDDLDLQAITEDDRFDTGLCRMAIQSFHFYKVQTLVSSSFYPHVVATACDLIDHVQSLADQRPGCVAMCPIQISFGLLLASTSLLRILKSTASHGLDTSRARSSLFTAINIAKQMSVDRSDLAAKTTRVLTSLWNSSRAFHKADGGECTAMRIRSRLVLSPVLDAVWWWKDEFDRPSRAVRSSMEPADRSALMHARYGGAVHTGSGLGAGMNVNPDIAGGMMVPPSSTSELNQNSVFQLDEQFLADFEWALGGDPLFSLDPLPADWTCTSNTP